MTTGGRISGSSTRPLSSECPQKRPRASAMAMAMPNGRLTRVATNATFRLSRTAVHSSGLRVIQSMRGFLSPPASTGLAAEAEGCQDCPGGSTVKPCASNSGFALADLM